jgi:hypothetical protein
MYLESKRTSKTNPERYSILQEINEVKSIFDIENPILKK